MSGKKFLLSSLAFICLCLIIKKPLVLFYLSSLAETDLTAASSTGATCSLKGLSSSEASRLQMKWGCDVSWVTVQSGLLFNSERPFWNIYQRGSHRSQGKQSTEHFDAHSKGLMSNLGSFIFVEPGNRTLFQTDTEKHSLWREKTL